MNMFAYFALSVPAGYAAGWLGHRGCIGYKLEKRQEAAKVAKEVNSTMSAREISRDDAELAAVVRSLR